LVFSYVRRGEEVNSFTYDEIERQNDVRKHDERVGCVPWHLLVLSEAKERSLVTVRTIPGSPTMYKEAKTVPGIRLVRFLLY